ncbi:MAG: hypothetical protein IJS03_07045 [Eubacterium sp.]|nr:hypothetical protein [Eubacterium sp.]
MHNKRIKYLIDILISVIICSLIVSIPVGAFAANDDYLQPEKWSNNKKVRTSAFQSTAAGDKELSGKFSYYSDNAEMTLYTCVDISKTTLDADYYDSISVTYTFRTAREDYVITIDKDGLHESLGGESKYFNTKQNFIFDGSATYCISYVEYIGKEDKGVFDVSIYTDSKFKLKDNIKLIRPQKSTNKSPSTTCSVNKSTTKKGSNSKDSKTTEKHTNKVLDYEELEKKSSATKSTTTKKDETTKYKNRIGEYYTADRKAGATKPKKSDTSDADSEISNNAKAKSNAKMLMYIGIGIILLGFLYLIFILGREFEKKKKIDTDIENNDE